MMGRQWHLLAAASVVFLVIVASLAVLHSYSDKTQGPVKPAIAFFLQGGSTDIGWGHQHAVGIQAAADKLKMPLRITDRIPAGTSKCEQAIRETAAEGSKILFLGSADYAKDMTSAIENGSDLLFIIPDLEQSADAHCVPYFIRLYQGEYLAGLLAGMRTKSGHIGYVASMPLPETTRGINAFTLGVRQIRPDADVIVCWIGTWDDADKEIQAAEQLTSKAGVDVLNSHQDQANVQAFAAQHGVDYFGYLETRQPYSEHNLATVVCNWDMVYMKILQDFQQGHMKSIYWLGLADDAIGLKDYSPLLTESDKRRLEEYKWKITSGQTVFSGEIHDNQGKLRCAQDESISDDTLIRMNWYVEGVKFYEDIY